MSFTVLYQRPYFYTDILSINRKDKFFTYDLVPTVQFLTALQVRIQL